MLSLTATVVIREKRGRGWRIKDHNRHVVDDKHVFVSYLFKSLILTYTEKKNICGEMLRIRNEETDTTPPR